MGFQNRVTANSKDRALEPARPEGFPEPRGDYEQQSQLLLKPQQSESTLSLGVGERLHLLRDCSLQDQLVAEETCHAHSATGNVSVPTWRNLIAPRLDQGVMSTDMLNAGTGNGDREFCDAWARRQHLSLTVTTNNRRKVRE